MDFESISSTVRTDCRYLASSRCVHSELSPGVPAQEPCRISSLTCSLCTLLSPLSCDHGKRSGRERGDKRRPQAVRSVARIAQGMGEKRKERRARRGNGGCRPTPSQVWWVGHGGVRSPCGDQKERRHHPVEKEGKEYQERIEKS